MLNSYQFSAAKDIAETKSMQSLVYEASSFKDFKEKASEITNINNDQWLRVEMDACKRGTVQGEAFRQAESDKDLYPYWAYKTEDDGNVRPEHAALEGIVFMIGDPEGDACWPPVDWNCRCHAEPVDGQYLKENDKQVSKGSDYLEKDDPKTGKPYVDEDFRFNPGKQGAMPNDSSYSEVFSSANKGNEALFDLPTIQKVEELLNSPIDMSKYNNYELYDLDKDVDKARKGVSLLKDISNKDLISLTGDTPDDDMIIKKIDVGLMSQNDMRLAIKTDKYENLVTISKYGKNISYEIDHVDVLEGFKGSGLGAKMFANMLDAAENNGFETIDLTAAKGLVNGKEYNGYYTWARFGFELHPAYQEKFLMLVKTEGTNEVVRNAKSLQELMKTKEGQELWKKKGFQYKGIFDIKKDKDYFLNYFNHKFK
jgi:SPP1 gp7 family putative phage head morphogenesis protein